MSPIGVKPVFPGEPPLNPYKRFEGKANGPPRGTLFIGKWMWGKKISPLTPGRNVPRKLAVRSVATYIVRRQKCDQDE